MLACSVSLAFYLLFHATNEHGTIYINYVATTTRGRSNTEIELSIRRGSVGGIIPDSALDDESPPPYILTDINHQPRVVSPLSESSLLASTSDTPITPPRSVYHSTGVAGTAIPMGKGSQPSSPLHVSSATISPRAGQTAQIDLPYVPMCKFYLILLY